MRPRQAIVVAAALILLFCGSAQSLGAKSRPHRQGRHPHGAALAPPRPSVVIGVHESEYRIRLSRASVSAGAVTVDLRNLGQDPHNLVIERADGSGTRFVFAAGTSGSHQMRTLSLSPGGWVLYCSLPGHRDLGMSATVEVK